MKIVAIADTHGYLPDDLPAGDILLICGDVVPPTNFHHTLVGGSHWLLTEYKRWLDAQPFKHIVGIAGNHDFAFQQNPSLGQQLPWIYLEDSYEYVNGLKIWGSPWTPWFYDWAFNGPADPLESEKFFSEKWSNIPDDCDIVITHGPPHGICDVAPGGRKCGCPHLKSNVYGRVIPKLHAYGHIHLSRGTEIKNGVISANVAYLGESYKPNNQPYFELEI